MKVINISSEENGKVKKRQISLMLRNGRGSKEHIEKVFLVAVDEITNNEICMLMAIYPSKGKSRTYPMSKEKLEQRNYDTSFTEWDSNGAMFIDSKGTFN